MIIGYDIRDDALHDATYYASQASTTSERRIVSIHSLLLITFFFVLAVIALLGVAQIVRAENYSVGIYGLGDYSIGEETLRNVSDDVEPMMLPIPPQGTPSPAGSGGGGGGGGGALPPKIVPPPRSSTSTSSASPSPVVPLPTLDDVSTTQSLSTTVESALSEDINAQIAELKSRGISTERLNSMNRDVRNALIAKDYERASELSLNIADGVAAVEKTQAIIDELERRMGDDGSASGDVVTDTANSVGIVTGNVVMGDILLENSIAKNILSEKIIAHNDAATEMQDGTALMTGNAIFSSKKTMPITESLMQRARDATKNGDYEVGLALARQAEASYMLENKLTGGSMGLFVQFGMPSLIIILIIMITAFILRIIFVRRSELIASGVTSVVGAPFKLIFISAIASQFARIRREFAALPRKGWFFFWVFLFLLFISISGVLMFQTSVSAALQEAEMEHMGYISDQSASYLTANAMHAQAIGEDLTSLTLSEFDNDKALHDPAYLDAFTKKLSVEFSSFGKNAKDVQGVYMYLDPDVYGMHYIWYIREGEGFPYRPDSFENETGYLSKASAVWSQNESFMWYYNPLRNQTPQWTPAYYDADLKMYTISYLRPVMFEGKFIGMVGVDLTLDGVQRTMAADPNREGKLLVIDSAGQFIVGTPDAVVDWNSVLPRLTDTRGGLYINGQDIGYAKVFNGMTVLNVIDESTSALPMDNLQTLILITNIFVIVALFLLWLYVNDLLLRVFSPDASRHRHIASRKVRITLNMCVMVFVILFAFTTYVWVNSTIQNVEEVRVMLGADHISANIEPRLQYIISTTNNLNILINTNFDIGVANKNKSYAISHLEEMSDEFELITKNSGGVVGTYVYLDADKYRDPIRGIPYLWYTYEEGVITRQDDSEALLPNYLSVRVPTWRSNPDYVWYYDALLKGSSSWTGVYYDSDLQHNCVSYVQPVFKNQQLIGVVGIDVDLTDIQDSISSDADIEGNVYLLDKDDEFILGNSAEIRAWDEARKRMTLERGGFMLDEQDFGYKRLSNGMLVVTVLDESVTPGSFDRLQRNLLFMVVFFTMLTLVVLFGFLVVQMRDGDGRQGVVPSGASRSGASDAAPTQKSAPKPPAAIADAAQKSAPEEKPIGRKNPLRRVISWTRRKSQK